MAAEMKCRFATPILILLMLSVGLAGCSEGAEKDMEPWPPSNSRALDRKVLTLEPGMSIEGVRAKLGEPLEDNVVEGEPVVEMLFYGRWQIVFEDGRLDRRIKYVIERPIPDPRVIDKKEHTLTRKVLNLQPGATSIAAVRAKFGTPDIYEIFKNAPGKEEALSYHPWALTFVDGILEHRSK